MIFRTFTFLLLGLCAPGLPGQQVAGADSVRKLRIPRVERPPKLSDFIDGVPRKAELVITDFRQYLPGDGSPASAPTIAYLSYDDVNLYFGFLCEDDRKLIRARVSKREQVFRDDRISICIDTFHDHRHMYWFDVNPYGIQADGNVTDGVEDDPSWDTLWYSEAKFTDKGYAVFVTIPFKSFRFPNQEKQTWGLIIGRWIMRNNEYSVWPYVSRRLPGFVQQGGDLDGFHDISPGRNIQLIPYGLFSRSRYLDTAPGGAPEFRKDQEARVGLDAKLVLKDAFTLDVALNPDFSQVESDEPQVTINQRYEVFFPEKRPFFMENGGYFKTPEQLFFSRRIQDPRLGARLTGKAGPWALGALVVDDRAPGAEVDRNDPLRGGHALAGVFRLQREFRKNSNVAAMVTSQDFGLAYNRVFALDTRLQLLRNWTLTGQAMASNTQVRDGPRLAGPAYFLQWAHEGRHLVSETKYADRSPNFRSQLGFFDRVDIRQATHTIGYNWRPEASPVLSYGPHVTGLINYDRQGRLQDWQVNPRLEVEMRRETKITVGRFEVFELFSDRGFRRQYNDVKITSEWQKWLAVKGSFNNGAGVNYYPGSGYKPFLGRMRKASLGLTFRSGARARIDETYIYSGLRIDASSGLPGERPDAVIFDNHIVRSKVNYNFNREMSVRVIVDYNSVLPNGSLVNLEKTKHVGADALFTYMLNPGTALHIGYTDLYDNFRLDPMLSPALRRTTFPDLNTGRQIFAKLSYLFRF